jgi:uncharacterized membrane protein
MAGVTAADSFEVLLARADQLGERVEAVGEPHAAALRQRKRLTLGQRAADSFAGSIGSWRFIIAQTVILLIWIVLNVLGWLGRWDPYPFILLNLILSFQAAYAGPIIMMSQNRASDLDRLQAHADFAVNEKAELEVEQLLTLLRAQIALTELLRAELVAQRQGPAEA